MEVYRVTKDSPDWLFKAYDYVRTDAFCFGQGIPIEGEFSHDGPVDENYRAVVLVEDHKPVAGCRIAYPEKHIGKIERVCVTRACQKSGVGRLLIGEAEKWIADSGVRHIVINSQDRAQVFYEKLGYVLNPEVDPRVYEAHFSGDREVAKHGYVPQKNQMGFACVLVEKELDHIL
ncbi:MAG: GNAT family N-acetyltransferase [Lachnospiraceae bacterium]|nr:GNAT family N-acetyltransferase [Lachnospiraceae bacterium]